jgi:hypothetical protein
MLCGLCVETREGHAADYKKIEEGQKVGFAEKRLSILCDIWLFAECLFANFPESRLTFCSVFRQTAAMETEIDCALQSDSRYVCKK